jgi:3-methyl-2-oxobutanoate hydroxymethyltransferase
MSSHTHVSRKTINTIRNMKGKAKIVCLTAYTAPMALWADNVCDLILVGDSVGNVLYGFDTTLPVTVDMMIAHGAAVVRGSQKSLIVVDMPFGSYQESHEQAFRNASRIIKETGCAAVKLEGGAEMASTVSFLVQRGIAVMGHIGLRPQQVHAMGGYRIAGKNDEAASQVLNDAKAIADAGAFSIVIEGTIESLAAEVTQSVHVPTIGIGASVLCDGQILVTEDMVGLTPGHKAKFVKQYANLEESLQSALAQYADEVRREVFPSSDYTY